MAIESGDLLTLLKRVRKPMDEAGPRVDVPPVLTETGLTPRPEPARAAEHHEAEQELAGLRAELLADELLIERILGILYRSKKKNPNGGYVSILDMERILNIEREGASFVMSFMKIQKVIEMDDKSRMAITVPGIVYLRHVLGLDGGAAAPVE